MSIPLATYRKIKKQRLSVKDKLAIKREAKTITDEDIRDRIYDLEDHDGKKHTKAQAKKSIIEDIKYTYQKKAFRSSKNGQAKEAQDEQDYKASEEGNSSVKPKKSRSKKSKSRKYGDTMNEPRDSHGRWTT